jgi:hypothetical protein
MFKNVPKIYLKLFLKRSRQVKTSRDKSRQFFKNRWPKKLHPKKSPKNKIPIFFSGCYKGIDFVLPPKESLNGGDKEGNGYVNVDSADLAATFELEQVALKFKEMG